MNNTGFFAILIGGLLVNNFVLSQFLGICPFLGVSKKLNSAVGMSVAVIFVMLMATAATHPIYTYLLVPNKLEYLQTIVFILIIAALVQLVEIALRRFLPPLYKALPASPRSKTKAFQYFYTSRMRRRGHRKVPIARSSQ